MRSQRGRLNSEEDHVRSSNLTRRADAVVKLLLYSKRILDVELGSPVLKRSCRAHADGLDTHREIVSIAFMRL